MQTTKWPARDTAEYERVMDHIATGGRASDPSEPALDPSVINRQLAVMRSGAPTARSGDNGALPDDDASGL